MAARLFVHADARVSHHHADALWVLGECADVEPAAVGHGIDGVVEEVQQDLPEGVGVDLQARQLA